MSIYELAALAAAACWAASALLSSGPAAHLGAPAFNRLRQALVFAMLAAYVLVSGSWATIRGGEIGLILLSGLVGIFVGDTLLFACMNRLGPRRSSILFATNAPFAALLGWLVLSESLSAQAIAGIVISFIGVTMAIYFGGARPTQNNDAHGSVLWSGVAFGVGSAICQALATLIMRPIMKTGIDPFAASMLRVGVGAAALSIMIALPIAAAKPKNTINRTVVWRTAASGFLALAVGMSLLLFALSGGQVGIVSILSATTPVMILPLIWWKTGVRPALGAWAGAGVTMAGLALIFAR